MKNLLIFYFFVPLFSFASDLPATHVVITVENYKTLLMGINLIKLNEGNSIQIDYTFPNVLENNWHARRTQVYSYTDVEPALLVKAPVSSSQNIGTLSIYYQPHNNDVSVGIYYECVPTDNLSCPLVKRERLYVISSLSDFVGKIENLNSSSE